MLCDSCHQREATCHVTHINADKMDKRDLCPECFMASPEGKAMLSAQRDARCVYCGGQPCIYHTDEVARTMGVEKSKYMCVRCFFEHSRYVGEQVARFASPPGFQLPEEDVSAGSKLSEGWRTGKEFPPSRSHLEQIA